MKRALVIGGVAAGLWAWLRRKRPEPEPWSEAPPPPAPTEAPPRPPEPAPASGADPAVREAESRLDDETKYDRAVEAETEERHRAAERLKRDPLDEERETPPDDAA